jgi:hypothetical protein
MVFMCSPGTFNTDCFPNINRLDAVVIECVFCKTGIGFLNVIHISASVQVVKSVYVCACWHMVYHTVAWFVSCAVDCVRSLGHNIPSELPSEMYCYISDFLAKKMA